MGPSTSISANYLLALADTNLNATSSGCGGLEVCGSHSEVEQRIQLAIATSFVHASSSKGTRGVVYLQGILSPSCTRNNRCTVCARPSRRFHNASRGSRFHFLIGLCNSEWPLDLEQKKDLPLIFQLPSRYCRVFDFASFGDRRHPAMLLDRCAKGIHISALSIS